jgi:FKBP-type peptidyl-prolyl cis-trans isomerase FklB
MPIRHFSKKTLVIGVISCLLIACSDGRTEQEEAEFRKSLIDKALNDDTRKAGDAFLADNAKREGVITTASGLQYEVVEQASDLSTSPRLGDQVDVFYSGITVDGHEFANTLSAYKPSTFPLNKVIKGWREALMLMHPGDHWIIYLPPELAYGATSPSTDIPANSALIYHIKLVGFQTLDEQTQSGNQHE